MSGDVTKPLQFLLLDSTSTDSWGPTSQVTKLHTKIHLLLPVENPEKFPEAFHLKRLDLSLFFCEQGHVSQPYKITGTTRDLQIMNLVQNLTPLLSHYCCDLCTTTVFGTFMPEYIQDCTSISCTPFIQMPF